MVEKTTKKYRQNQWKDVSRETNFEKTTKTNKELKIEIRKENYLKKMWKQIKFMVPMKAWKIKENSKNKWKNKQNENKKKLGAKRIKKNSKNKWKNTQNTNKTINEARKKNNENQNRA